MIHKNPHCQLRKSTYILISLVCGAFIILLQFSVRTRYYHYRRVFFTGRVYRPYVFGLFRHIRISAY